MNGTAPERILIVLMGAIGDVVRGLPLATRIRKHWPEVRITWAVEPICRPLVDQHPAIDRVLVFDRPRGFKAYLEFVREMRSEPYDLVLDLQRHFKSGMTSMLCGASRRLGYDRGNAREFNWLFNNEHISATERYSPKILQFQKFGDHLGLPAGEELDFGLQPKAEELSRIEELFAAAPASAGYAALILGSTWESRLWFPERYRDLIEQLYRRWGYNSVLIGGGRERGFADEILSGGKPGHVIDLVQQTGLRELAAVFGKCRVAIGSDSGPMHIASAVGTPVVSLWGSTSSRRSGPWGSEKYVLQSPIGCSPCYLRTCPGLGRLCMSSIPTTAVTAQIQRMFDEGRIIQ